VDIISNGLFALLAAIVGAVGGAWANDKFVNKKRIMKYQWGRNVSLLATAEDAPSSLVVMHGNRTLVKPRLVDITVRNEGAKAITHNDFNERDALVINLDGEIIEVLSAQTDLPNGQVPAYVRHGSELVIPPCLIKPKQGITFQMLIDGMAENLAVRSPFADIEEKTEAEPSAADLVFRAARYSRRASWMNRIILAVASVAVVSVIYLDNEGKTYTSSDVCKGTIKATEAVHKDLCGK
jgi:hypothetical protein